MKCPYKFPHRSRRAKIEFLTNHEGHCHGNDWFPFAWNIKVYQLNWMCHGISDFNLQPRFDERWSAYLEKHDEIFWHVCSDALRYYIDGEWCSYPGDDQGDWHFYTSGRSGGWLVLDQWRRHNLYRVSRDSFLDGLDSQELTAFYRGVICLDKDLERPEQEVNYHLAFQRQLLEEEWDAAETEAMRAIEESRPDMYAT